MEELRAIKIVHDRKNRVLYNILAEFFRFIGIFVLEDAVDSSPIEQMCIRDSLYAYLLSYVICCTLLIICINPVKVLKYTTQSKKKSDLHEMVKYSIYLIPNSVFWWITNSSDKYMILYLIGSMYNGKMCIRDRSACPVSHLTFFRNIEHRL